jgi:4-hydroxy-tetrahydrodipicolinate reductase
MGSNEFGGFMHQKVAVFGANGRMGKLLCEALNQESHLQLGTAIDRHTAFEKMISQGDIACIDFSVADASPLLLTWLNENLKNLPQNFCLLSGVTGLDQASMDLMKQLATKIPVFHATNFSMGILFLNQMLKQASAFLKDFDIEVFELHHKQKKDAPSGTALTLAQSLSEARAGTINTQSSNYPRQATEVHVSAGRGGQVIGDHFVYLLSPSERLEFVHRAQDRRLFVQGAIKALSWLKAQPIGFYQMDDLWQAYQTQWQKSLM